MGSRSWRAVYFRRVGEPKEALGIEDPDLTRLCVFLRRYRILALRTFLSLLEDLAYPSR